MKASVFIAADGGYLRYARALIRSISETLEEHNVRQLNLGRATLGVDLHFLYSGDPPKEEIERDAGGNCWVVFHRMSDDYRGKLRAGNQIHKQPRYAEIERIMGMYNSAVVFDADMIVVSPNFWDLVRLVEHQPQLIGCNEAIKWRFDDRYRRGERHSHGLPFFSEPRRALKFMCNVPLVFNPKAWSEVFRCYAANALKAFEIDDEAKPKKLIADLFLWNLSVEFCNRRDDLRLLPMEQLTGVHYTYARPQTRIERRDDGRFYSVSGDEVYTLHGRALEPGWVDRYLSGALQKGEHINQEKARRSLDQIVEEWRKWDPESL